MRDDRREVYIVDGARTPFLKARGKPGPFSASDLAVQAGRELLAYQPFSPDKLDDVVMGCVCPSADEANIARIVALRLGTGKHVPAWTVQRNCASGMQAVASAAEEIAIGRHDLVLAGGTEAMSRAPLLYSPQMVQWFADMMRQKTLRGKLRQWLRFRLTALTPIVSLLRGLTDPFSGWGMGQTAEEIAHKYGITREMMDVFSVQSHARATAAFANHFLSEIVPLYDDKGNVYLQDEGVRADSTVQILSSLPPFFDKPYGNVTAANSSQISDGAAMMILASGIAVKKYGLPVMGRLVDTAWAGCEPTEMGMGPCYAIARLLKQHYLQRNDIHYWEINEAFAGQVLACLRAFQDETFCRDELGLDRTFGEISQTQLNIDGGAISIGHPVGATGARLVLHTLQVLKRTQQRLGVASLCIGGGQGSAMLIENVTEVAK